MGIFGPTSSSTSSSSNPANHEFKVFVDYDGNAFEYTMLGGTDISAVKQTISDDQGIAVESMILQYKGTALEDGQRLVDYRFHNRGRIQLSLAE